MVRLKRSSDRPPVTVAKLGVVRSQIRRMYGNRSTVFLFFANEYIAAPVCYLTYDAISSGRTLVHDYVGHFFVRWAARCAQVDSRNTAILSHNRPRPHNST